MAAKKDNVTTKFTVDVSDLKKNIADAERSIKLYRAELKNADAGMAQGEKSAESLSKKIAAQSKIVYEEQTKLAELKEQLDRYEKAMEDGEKTIADLTEKQKKAAEQYGESSKEAQELAKQLDKALAAQQKNANAADELRIKIVNQDTAVKNASAQTESFRKALDDLENEEKQADDSTEELTKEIKGAGDQAQSTTDGGLSAFGVALGNLAANLISAVVDKLGELITQTIETGKTFEESMSKVSAISGAVGEDVTALTEKAKELGVQTKFTASEVADGFSYMAMAGWKTEDMLDGIDGMLNLAAASGADLAATSDIVTDALTAFGESADQAGRLADIMAAASSNANTNVELMGETFKYAAPLAGSLGFSMEDTAVAIGLMANSGIKGTQAGTSLRSIMTRLAAPTKESGTAMAQLGIEIEKVNEDGTKTMKSLSEIMGELRDKFGDINIPLDEFNSKLAQIEAQQASLDAQLAAGEIAEQQYKAQTKSLAAEQEILMERAYGSAGALNAQYASMIAGKNSLSGFLALVNASDEDFEKLTAAINDSEGAAAAMAETMQDNLAGDMTKLGSAFEGFQLALYDKFSTPLREVVQNVTNDIIPLFSDVINGVSGATDKLAEKLSDLVGNILSGLVDALPQVVDVLISLIGSLSEKLIDMAPQLVTAASKVITTLLKALSRLLPSIAEKIVDTLPALVDALMRAMPEIINALIELANAIVQKLPVIIKKLAAELPAMVKTIADTITEQLPAVLQAGIDIFNALVEAIPEVLPALVDALPELVDTIINFLIDNSKTLVEANVKALSAMIDAIPIVIEALAPQIPRIIDAVVHGILDNSDKILDAIVSIGESVIGLGSDFIANLPEWLEKVLTPINDYLIQPAKQAFAELFDWFGTFDINEKISDVLLECEDTIKLFFAFVVDTWSNAVDFFTDIPENFKEWFTDAWSNVKDVFAGVGEFFGGLWDTIVQKFKDVGTKVGEAVGNTFKKAINAVLETVEDTINSVPEAINNAIDLLNELPGVDIGQMDYIKLPRLAKGGVIDKSTLAMLGESGREAVLPLENNKAGLKEIADLLAGEMLGSSKIGVNGGKAITNTYTFNQTNNSPKALSRWEIYRDTKNLINTLKMEGAV